MRAPPAAKSSAAQSAVPGARAAQRGCRTVYMDTFSFQAPAFYHGRGYAVAAELRGFPDGIVKFLLVKPLRVSER